MNPVHRHTVGIHSSSNNSWWWASQGRGAWMLLWSAHSINNLCKCRSVALWTDLIQVIFFKVSQRSSLSSPVLHVSVKKFTIWLCIEFSCFVFWLKMFNLSQWRWVRSIQMKTNTFSEKMSIVQRPCCCRLNRTIFKYSCFRNNFKLYRKCNTVNERNYLCCSMY